MSSSNQLRRFIKQAMLNEMPVSKSRSYGSQTVDTRHPHLKELAHEIDELFVDYSINATVEMFDSGYIGISIEFADPFGDKQEWIVVDQPGKVGPEDQSMGYIFFGEGKQAIQESNAWIWEKVPYLGRKFGDANMRSDVRDNVYSKILDSIEEFLSETEDYGHTNQIGEGSKNMKFSRKQLRNLIKEELDQQISETSTVSEFQLAITQEQYNQFADEIYPWIDADDVKRQWEGTFPDAPRLEPEALAYLISNLDANGLIGDEDQMAAELLP